MVKIRYCDPNELSPGLHAAAERIGRNTTVYLLSGLTAQERQAALRRLRLSARMGYCPPLPAPQLGLALLADRIRTSVGQTGAVFRSHPAGSTVPVMAVSAGAIVFLLFSTVSIRVLHTAPASMQPAAAGPAPAVTAIAARMPRSSQVAASGGLGRAGQADSVSGHQTQTKSGSSASSTFTWPTISGTETGAVAVTGAVLTSSGTSVTDSTSSGARGGGTRGGGWRGGTGSSRSGYSSSSGGASGRGGGQSSRHGYAGDSDATAAPADSASPSPTATPTTKPAPDPTASSNSDSCLDVGPLGFCLDV